MRTINSSMSFFIILSITADQIVGGWALSFLLLCVKTALASLESGPRNYILKQNGQRKMVLSLVLWECIFLIDQEGIDKALGGGGCFEKRGSLRDLLPAAPLCPIGPLCGEWGCCELSPPSPIQLPGQCSYFSTVLLLWNSKQRRIE